MFTVFCVQSEDSLQAFDQADNENEVGPNNKFTNRMKFSLHLITEIYLKKKFSTKFLL